MANCYKCGKSESVMKCVCDECMGKPSWNTKKVPAKDCVCLVTAVKRSIPNFHATVGEPYIAFVKYSVKYGWLSGYGYQKILAWMEIPDPYREENH